MGMGKLRLGSSAPPPAPSTSITTVTVYGMKPLQMLLSSLAYLKTYLWLGTGMGMGKLRLGSSRPSARTLLPRLQRQWRLGWAQALTRSVGPFGIGTDLPVAGDWDGDGQAEIGVFRPSARTFYLDYNGKLSMG
jgi:hypothetical protein